MSFQSRVIIAMINIRKNREPRCCPAETSHKSLLRHVTASIANYTSTEPQVSLDLQSCITLTWFEWKRANHHGIIMWEWSTDCYSLRVCSSQDQSDADGDVMRQHYDNAGSLAVVDWINW
jgi:hypothetical protein